MYINDTHIGFYVGAIILGLIVGQFVDWMNKRLPEYKKVFTKEIFKAYLSEKIPNFVTYYSEVNTNPINHL